MESEPQFPYGPGIWLPEHWETRTHKDSDKERTFQADLSFYSLLLWFKHSLPRTCHIQASSQSSGGAGGGGGGGGADGAGGDGGDGGAAGGDGDAGAGGAGDGRSAVHHTWCWVPEPQPAGGR